MVLFIYSSTYLLVALSIDRWEAVVKPLAFTRNRSRGYYLVLAAWALSFICATPVTLYTRIKEFEGKPQCWIDLNKLGWKIYMVYLTCSLLIIPALIIAVCYTHIVYTIWTKGQLNLSNNSNKSQVNQKETKYRIEKKNLSETEFERQTTRSILSEEKVSVKRNIYLPSNASTTKVKSIDCENKSTNQKATLNGNSKEASSKLDNDDLAKQMIAIDEEVDDISSDSETNDAEMKEQDRREKKEAGPEVGLIRRKIKLANANSLGGETLSHQRFGSMESESESVCKSGKSKEGFPVSTSAIVCVCPVSVVGSTKIRSEKLSSCSKRRLDKPAGDKASNGVIRGKVENYFRSNSTPSNAEAISYALSNSTQHRPSVELSLPGKEINNIEQDEEDDEEEEEEEEEDTEQNESVEHLDKQQDKQTKFEEPKRRKFRANLRDCQLSSAQQHGTGVIPQARIKTIKMTLVIVAAFILCWAPFYIINLCSVFGLFKNETNFTFALKTLTQSLAHLNSAVNPIIFWLFSSKRLQTNNQRSTKTLIKSIPATESSVQPSRLLSQRQQSLNSTTGCLSHLFASCCSLNFCRKPAHRIKNQLNSSICDSRMFESTGTSAVVMLKN